MRSEPNERPPRKGGLFVCCQRAMPVSAFKVEILDRTIVVRHIRQGHKFTFQITSRGTVALRGALIELNPKAKRNARGYLLEAHKAAREALE